ncbi:MAG: DNA-processing protein DprA, partial [Solirubrobacterales bacterium]|nr:DNA-processing protein DprA [Solirubrobacterales bacterium]
YGREVAHSLGRGLAAAGVVVVSGMAMGVDAAAHEGALAVDGPTVAVLAGAPNVPYPAMKRALHAHLLRSACVVSEMPPGFRARRWSFPARNRIIAALTGMTVVVEATERSGSLITADIALQLGRAVGAVPGPVSSPLSAGANALLHDGAQVIRDAQDVLDAALPIGWSRPPAQADERARGDRCGGVGHQHLTGRATLPGAARPTVAPELSRVLELVDDGLSTAGAVAARLGDVTQATVSLTRLELLGVLRRERDGRYVRRLL